MRNEKIKVKYQVADGAVNIGEDVVDIELTEAQIDALVGDVGVIEHGNDEPEVIYHDNVLEDIYNILLEDAKKKYSDKAKSDLNAYCDTKQLIAMLKECI